MLNGYCFAAGTLKIQRNANNKITFETLHTTLQATLGQSNFKCDIRMTLAGNYEREKKGVLTE